MWPFKKKIKAQYAPDFNFCEKCKQFSTCEAIGCPGSSWIYCEKHHIKYSRITRPDASCPWCYREESEAYKKELRTY